MRTVRLATLKDLFHTILLKLIISTVFTIVGIMPLIANVTMLVLIFLPIGVLLLAATIYEIFKYVILREPYEFYIVKSGNTTMYCKGDKIGYPVNFSDLTNEQREELKKGKYDSDLNVNYGKFHLVDQKTLNKTTNIRHTDIVGIIVSTIVVVMVSVNFYRFAVAMMDNNTPIYFILILGAMYLLIVLSVVRSIYKRIKKDKTRNGMVEYIDKKEIEKNNLKNYDPIDEDDPFKDYYEKNKKENKYYE